MDQQNNNPWGVGWVPTQFSLAGLEHPVIMTEATYVSVDGRFRYKVWQGGRVELIDLGALPAEPPQHAGGQMGEAPEIINPAHQPNQHQNAEGPIGDMGNQDVFQFYQQQLNMGGMGFEMPLEVNPEFWQDAEVGFVGAEAGIIHEQNNQNNQNDAQVPEIGVFAPIGLAESEADDMSTQDDEGSNSAGSADEETVDDSDEDEDDEESEVLRMVDM